jgi:hypothetical protein
MFVTASNVRTGLFIGQAFDFPSVLRNAHIIARKLTAAVSLQHFGIFEGEAVAGTVPRRGAGDYRK